MLNTLISLLSPCALFYVVYLQVNQIRLIRKLETEISQLIKTGLKFPSKTLPYPLQSAKKRKAVHVDVEYVRVTAKHCSLFVVYRKLLDFLKADGSELEVKFYSTTHPRVQALNSQLRDMGCYVIEQPVFFSPEGKVNNTNTDALMVEGTIIDSPPQKFEIVVLISGDGKFAECARLLALRWQKTEFIGFAYNTAQEIKNLAENHDLVSYRSLESIPRVCTKAYPYRCAKKPT